MDKVILQSKSRLPYYLGIIAWLIYAGVSILAPRGGNTYNLNPVNFVLLQLTVIIPVLLIWMTAIYGAVKFRDYSSIIKGSPDGAALNKITLGLFLLVATFIFQTLLAVASRLAVGTPMLNPTVFLHNHVPVVMALISVIYIFMGSNELVAVVQAKVRQSELIACLAGYFIAASWMSWFMYNHISHNVTNGVPNFTIPGHWPFYTLVIPYLVAWLLSILSILNIVTYTRNVKGPIYKAGLKYAATGIMLVITFAMSVQVLTFMANALQKLRLSSILALVYLLLIAYALGFALIAIGARKLARIEVAQ